MTRAPRRRGRRAARGAATPRCSAACRSGQGSLRGRREAADRIEPGAGRRARAGLRRLGEAARGGDGPARPPAHARVRLRRDDRPGRQPVGARALGWRLERRVERRARVAAGGGGDRHRHGRLAPHPLVGVRDVDDQADARARLAARDRPAGADVRPSRADDSHRARLRAAAGGDGRRRAAGGAPAAAPLGRLAADRRARPRRGRGLRARSRRASRRAGRSAASRGPARRARRVLRPRPHRVAGVAPPVRRPLGRVPLLEPRAARARRGAGDDRRGVHREPGRPQGGRRRLARLARRAPARRDRRADPADRRPRPRPRATRSRTAISTISR